MRHILILLFIAITIVSYAQAQRGLVLTMGTASHHGVPISGAVVNMKGNGQQLLSDDAGAVVLSMLSAKDGDKYQLLNVTKNGYGRRAMFIL